MTTMLDPSFFTTLVEQARQPAPVSLPPLSRPTAGHVARAAQNGDSDDWVSVREADELGLMPEDALRTAIRRGKIASRVERNARLVSRASVLAYVERTYPAGQKRRGRPRTAPCGPENATRKATERPDRTPKPDAYREHFRQWARYTGRFRWPDPRDYHISDRVAITLQREVHQEEK